MSFIDLSLEDDHDDCLILSPCAHSGLGFACKLKGKQNKEMPPQNPNHHAVFPANTSSSRREAGIKEKENQVALFPAAAAASHNKRMRRAAEEKKKKKKENQVTLIPAATAAEKKKKTEIAEKKKKPPITVNKKIPGGLFAVVSPTGSIDFNMHKSLSGKKVILYGLPGYQLPVAHYTLTEQMDNRMRWRPFYENRVVKPYMEFIEKADYLKANGVDEIVFFSVNANVMIGAHKNRYIMERYNYLKFMSDYRNRYLNALGLEMDIPQEEGMPHRSRRFILLVDDLKVKFVNIESSDENFTIPCPEEIIKAFDQ